MRIAKRTNWIRARRFETLNEGDSYYPDASGYVSRKPGFTNMRNKNVTRRIGKPGQRTPLTYSFGRNDPFWYMFDHFDSI